MQNILWVALAYAAGWLFFYLISKATVWLDDRFFNQLFASPDDDDRCISEDD